MTPETQQDQSAPSGANLLVLLIILLASLMVTPHFESARFGRALIYLGATAVLLMAVFTNRRRARIFIPCLALAALALPVTWSTLVLDYAALFVASCVLESIFFGAVACVLLVSVLRRHMATLQSVFGAMCVYLLLGLAWSQLYWATERVDQESLAFAHKITLGEDTDAGTDAEELGAFHQFATDELATGDARSLEGLLDDFREVHAGPGKDGVAAYSQLIYFSFVTMSSLGYGDIYPTTPLTQTLTWMQSVLGQFYLAVLVAWIVSAIPRSTDRHSGLGSVRTATSR